MSFVLCPLSFLGCVSTNRIKYFYIFFSLHCVCRIFVPDSRVSPKRALKHLAFESENATRRLAKVYTWKWQSLHVEMTNSTRGIFNISWQLCG